MKDEEMAKLRKILDQPLNEEVGNIIAKQLAECEAWGNLVVIKPIMTRV